MTFYDDSQFRSGKNEGSKSLKRPMTLDLDSPTTASKKQRYAILTTPDLNMFKLGTPEIEKFLIANPSLATPTPNQIPNQNLFPKNVAEEQENYAFGYIDAALYQLHQAGGTNRSTLPVYLTTTAPTSVIRSPKSINGGVLTSLNPTIRPPSVDSNNSSSCNSNSMPVQLEFAIKEEYQTVPSDFSSPPLSPIGKPQPINMVDQERIKLERKRHRNRIAASKCRKRKLEKISQLEDKVKDLKGENAKLEAFADRLREQVYSLKQSVMEHVKKGCQIMVHQTS